MAVKQGGLKRALASLFLLCALLVLYLYWQQNHELPPVFSSSQHAVRVPLPDVNDKYASTPTARTSPPPPLRVLVVGGAPAGNEDVAAPADTNILRQAPWESTPGDPKELIRWTWSCFNNRCVRKESVHSGDRVSLATCNMICSSTQLWPQPTGTVRLGTRTVSFMQNQITFAPSAHSPAKELLLEAYDVFSENIAKARKTLHGRGSQKPDINSFTIHVAINHSREIDLKLNTDESYNLTITPSPGNNLVANIIANTFFGARHGLETLSQLIWWDEYAQGGMLKVLKGAIVEDSPKFAYRGLMLDTARNFFPVESVKRTLDGMAASKLNVFHWHISDSQSFPFDLPSVPQLAKYGAYGPDMIYSASDVRNIVKFAKVRGIRVMIEVDTPAHAGNGWTWGVKENLGQLAVCVNEQPWSLYCGEPPCGQLNPDNPNVYPILEKIYQDILNLTGEQELFHLGGDEVNLECWAQMRRSTMNYNYTDFHYVWGEFTQKAIQRLKSVNKGRTLRNIILWSSNLSKQPYIQQFLNKDEVVIQVWGSSQWPETPDLLNDGYRVIVSHVDAWYLDCGFGRWRENGDAACDPYRTWHQFYNHRPWSFAPNNSAKRRILGGEVCLWTEQVGEGSLDARIWPRAAAFAERLWADPHSSDGHDYGILEDVYTRLSTHRSRLKERGISAEAIWPYWCNDNPGMCL